MTPASLSLERFEAEPVAAPRAEERATPAASRPAPSPEPLETLEERLARARGEGRAEGFAAGAAEAEARGDAALRLVLSEISERLDDLAVALADRDAADMRVAREVAEALLAGVAPAFARAGLAAEAADAVAAALADRSAGRAPCLSVAPAQAAAVAAALREAGLAVEVASDSALGDLHARIDWPDSAECIDLDAGLDAARHVLDRHLNAARRRAAHG